MELHLVSPYAFTELSLMKEAQGQLYRLKHNVLLIAWLSIFQACTIPNKGAEVKMCIFVYFNLYGFK
jgi:hypothetical protein